VEPRRVRRGRSAPERAILRVVCGPSSLTHDRSSKRDRVTRHSLGRASLTYLVIDWTGLRLTALERATVQDLDEHRRAFLARRSIAKNKKPIWNELHDVLFDAVIDRLPPREDREPDGPLFPTSRAITSAPRSPAPVD
jgi:hypothetical protein